MHAQCVLYALGCCELEGGIRETNCHPPAFLFLTDGSSVYFGILLGPCLDIEYIWLHRFSIQYVTFMKQFTQNKEQSTSRNGNLTAAALLEHSAVKRMRGHQKSTRNVFFSKFALRFVLLENCEATSCILEAWVGMF